MNDECASHRFNILGPLEVYLWFMFHISNVRWILSCSRQFCVELVWQCLNILPSLQKGFRQYTFEAVCAKLFSLTKLQLGARPGSFRKEKVLKLFCIGLVDVVENDIILLIAN